MKQQKILLDLICTSRNVSGYSDSLPSLPQAAVMFTKLEGTHDEIEMENKKAFDGIDESGISDPGFEKKKETLQQITDRQEHIIENNIPANKNYASYSITLDQIKSDALRAFCLTFNHYSGSKQVREITLTDFPDQTISSLMEPLTLLGTALIKLEVLRHIEEEVAFRGSYLFYKRFDSVPDACRYYSDQFADTCTRKLLKERVKTYARIYDDGKELTDWSLINTRINAWWHHEENKYGKKTLKSF